MEKTKVEIKYIPLGGGAHLTYGNEQSPLGTLLSDIVNKENHNKVNDLFEHIMKGTTGFSSPTKEDTLMNLSTLKESENWVTDEATDAQGMHYKYSECVIGDVVHSIVTYDTIPENFKGKIPKEAKATTYSRIYTYNNNTKFATSYGYLHYVANAALDTLGSVVLAALLAGIRRGAALVQDDIENGENPEIGEDGAQEIGQAGEQAAAEEAGVSEVNITVDEDLLLEAAGEGLVEEGIVDIAMGPLGLLLLVGTIVIIAIIALILWIWSYIDRSFVSRVLLFNATKAAVTINARHFDNVNTDKKHLPGILNENSAVSKVLPAVFHRVPPMPPGVSTSSTHRKSRPHHDNLEDGTKQPCIHYTLYSIVNDNKILEGLGTLISLEPHNNKESSTTYNDFSNAFYQYTIRSTRDNIMGLKKNYDGADYSNLYNSLGTETTFLKENIGSSLEIAQATDALGGNRNGLYSVVKVLHDKNIEF